MSDFRPLWGGVGPLMANAIKNFHFDYVTTSLINLVGLGHRLVRGSCWNF